MKDILAIVTGGAHDESQLVNATLIAGYFNAALTVVVINELPDPQIYAADPALGTQSAKGFRTHTRAATARKASPCTR